jgi:hypothetical protein
MSDRPTLTLTLDEGLYSYTWNEPGLPINEHSAHVNLLMRELALVIQQCDDIGSSQGHELRGSGRA